MATTKTLTLEISPNAVLGLAALGLLRQQFGALNQPAQVQLKPNGQRLGDYFDLVRLCNLIEHLASLNQLL